MAAAVMLALLVAVSGVASGKTSHSFPLKQQFAHLRRHFIVLKFDFSAVRATCHLLRHLPACVREKRRDLQQSLQCRHRRYVESDIFLVLRFQRAIIIFCWRMKTASSLLCMLRGASSVMGFFNLWEKLVANQ